jgi:hypothetical protein
MTESEKILSSLKIEDLPEDSAPFENGDVFDEDTGQPLGTIEIQNSVELSVYRDGWWYVYKLDRKYEHDKD